MEELTNNTTKKYFTKYMMLWIIGWLLIFPVFFFFNWKKKIANVNRQILNIKQTMLSVCQIYHKKYITLLQTEIRNWNDAKNKEIFETQFTKYYHFKLFVHEHFHCGETWRGCIQNKFRNRRHQKPPNQPPWTR